MTIFRLIACLLLNIFVIPGAGHFLIKRKLRGALIMSLTITVIFIFFFHFMFLALAQIQSLPSQAVTYEEMLRFSQILSRDIVTQNYPIILRYLYILIGCYVVGIMDLIWIYVRGRNRGLNSQ